MYEKSKLFTLPQCDPVVEMEPWRKALLDAAEYIRVHGLCKDGQYENQAGQVCAWGALGKVGKHDAFIGAFNALTARVGNIPSWNDMPETTPAMVIAILEECARS